MLHALVIAIVMAAGFTGALVLGGPGLYRAMGGTGGALAAALAYSNIVFGGAIAVWLFNTLASVVRGTGNMLLPASVVVAGAALTLGLSPALIFGWGPVPPLGIAGAAAALVAYYAAGSLVLLAYLAVRAEPRPAVALRPPVSAAVVRGDPAGRGAEPREQCPDEPDGRPAHGARRTVRHGGARRLSAWAPGSSISRFRWSSASGPRW